MKNFLLGVLSTLILLSVGTMRPGIPGRPFSAPHGWIDGVLAVSFSLDSVLDRGAWIPPTSSALLHALRYACE